MTFRSSFTVSFAFVLGAVVGCWNGAGSEGLPCLSNDHCGLGLQCEDGFCGGTPSDELCGNGWVDPNEACDDGEDNADEAACKTDCTAQACGDGFVGPEELCDSEGESAECDVDCTPVVCGDNIINASAGEECEADGVLPCMANCTLPLLWDDMEVDSPTVAWTHEKVGGEPEVTDTWQITNRTALGSLAWDSGKPAANSGDIRLMTPELDLGPYVGESIQLRFEHERRFVDCMDNLAYEGAVVEVSVAGGPYEVITPDNGYGGMVEAWCENSPPSPLEGQPAFTLDREYTTETFDLSSYAGSTIKIGFRLASDCRNCPENEMSQDARGWFIDNVTVWRN